MEKSDPPAPLAVFGYDQVANRLADEFRDNFGGARRTFDGDGVGDVFVRPNGQIALALRDFAFGGDDGGSFAAGAAPPPTPHMMLV